MLDKQRKSFVIFLTIVLILFIYAADFYRREPELVDVNSNSYYVPKQTPQKYIPEQDSDSEAIIDIDIDEVDHEPTTMPTTNVDLQQTQRIISDDSLKYDEKMLQQKQIRYVDIVPFFEEYKKKHPLKLLAKLQNLFDNIEPWPILTSNPNKTLIPFVHIPKTAGSTFKDELLNKFSRDYNSKQWPYRKCLFSNSNQKGSISPGCHTSFRATGNSHCRFSEISECIEGNYANLFDDKDLFQEEYFAKKPRPRAKTLDMKNYAKNLIKNLEPGDETYRPIDITDFQNIKYLGNIRHPVVRGLSEFYYRLPRDPSHFEHHLSWTIPMSRNSVKYADPKNTSSELIPTLKEWVKTPDNIAFNRQTRSYYPEKPRKITRDGLYSYTTYRTTAYKNYNKATNTNEYYLIGPENTTYAYSEYCANSNGALDWKYSMDNFGETSGQDNLNFDQEIAYKTIKNILDKFLYINFYEEMDQSLAVFSVIARIFHPVFSDESSTSKNIISIDSTSDVISQVRYFKKILNSNDLKGIAKFNQDFLSKSQNTIGNHPMQDHIYANVQNTANKKTRKRRNAHSTKAVRPEFFDTELLIDIYEKNQLDMIVWLYFKKKFEVTREFYLSV